MAIKISPAAQQKLEDADKEKSGNEAEEAATRQQLADPAKLPLKLAMHSRYHTDGVLYEKGKAYLFDREEAMEMLTRVDDMGRPVFNVYVPKPKKVVMEQDGLEIQTVPSRVRTRTTSVRTEETGDLSMRDFDENGGVRVRKTKTTVKAVEIADADDAAEVGLTLPDAADPGQGVEV